ncbi:MAG: NHLP bacteriocin export ABC transporter permease/ATPase subunit [Vicinamibacterales bacterium]
MMDPASTAGRATRMLDARRAVPLATPGVGWLIEAGAADVLAVGAPDGGPRLLFTARPGDVVFALSRGGVDVIVAAVEPTTVRDVSLDQFDESNARAAVMNWGERMAAALGDGPRHEEWPNDGAPQLLETWRAWAVARLAAMDHEEARRLEARLERQHHLGARAARRALGRLQSAARGRAALPDPPEGSPLLQAVALVGRRLGIAVHAPELAHGQIEQLAAIARRGGFHTREVRLVDGWWRRDNGPLVGWIHGDGRPVALLPDGPRRYDLVDPTTGDRLRVTAEVAAGLSTRAHCLYPRLPAGPASPRTLVELGLRGRHRDLSVFATAGVAATLLAMVAAPATALLLDVAIPDADRNLIWQLGLGLLAAAFGRMLFDVAAAFASVRAETGAAADLQFAVWSRVLELRLPFLRRFSIGDLHARIGAIDAMSERLSAASVGALFAGVASLLNVALMVWYSPRLAGWALGLLALVLLAMTVGGLLQLRGQAALQQQAGETLGLTLQVVQNVTKLRVAAAERRAFDRWTTTYADQQRTAWRIHGVRNLVTIGVFILPAASLALVFAAAGGAGGALAGELTPGTFLAFNAAFGALVAGVSLLSTAGIESLNAVGSWQRARPLLQSAVEVQPYHVQAGTLRGEVTLTGVTFRYSPDGPPVLDGVSIQAAPGEFVALVGPSGSGKSTLLRLLLGFETPESGVVAYDGRDLAGLDVRSVRRQLGVVMQQSRVTAASIFENIAAGASIALGDAWTAARQAGFAEDIEAFPMGMHTFVTEGGTNLSGGQRQRLLIARALATRPRVLVFDEATSALDNRTQDIVSRSIEALGVTRIVIAHRLSTIRRAHRIYVIESGRIVESGGFEELARSGGVFARLMARQSL